MYTLHQLPRIKRKKKIRAKALKGCPQRRGVCVRLAIMPPRKPNSARRKAARVRVSTKKEVFAYIPGIGHNLLKFSHVLLRGGNIPDLPGVHYTMIRGAKDLHGIRERTSARSKYGTKMWRSVKKKTRVAAITAFKKKIIESGEFSYNNYARQYEKFRQNRRLFIFFWRLYLSARHQRFLRKISYFFVRKIKKPKKKSFFILPRTSISSKVVPQFGLPQSQVVSNIKLFNKTKKSFSINVLYEQYCAKNSLYKKKKIRKKLPLFAEYTSRYQIMEKVLPTSVSAKKFQSKI